MSMTITQTSGVTAQLLLSDPMEDGTVFSDQNGAFTRNITSDTCIAGEFLTNNNYRAYVIWTISDTNLSNFDSIENLYFKYSTLFGGSSNHAQIFSTVTAGEISNPCGSTDAITYHSKGTYYAEKQLQRGGNKLITIGDGSTSTACKDLRNQLNASATFFSILMKHNAEWDNPNYSTFKSEDNATSNPNPTLVVDYTYSLTVTLDDPTNISYSQRQNVKKFAFWDGTYSTSDWGKSAEGIIIEGVETSGASTSMASIRDMMDNGYYVTIAGLPDSSLNTTYIIADLSFVRRGGFVDKYEYTLSLEKYED